MAAVIWLTCAATVLLALGPLLRGECRALAPATAAA
jgi:hypothetical protein